MKPASLLPFLLPLSTSLTIPPPQQLYQLATRQNNPINEFLGLITSLFPLNIVVDKIGGAITIAELALAAILHTDITDSDLTSGVCGNVLVIFARGTTEPGNVGSLVGPPFFDALREQLGPGRTLAVQGVDNYDADVNGYLQGGDEDGSARMAQLVSQAVRQCPQTKIVMSGYSQGGQLVHNAAKLLPASTMAATTVVIFGDPYSKYPVQGANPANVLIVCHLGDNICDNGTLILLPHLTYALDADTAAAFVVARAGS